MKENGLREAIEAAQSPASAVEVTLEEFNDVQDGGDALTIFNAAQIDDDMWQFDEMELSVIRKSLTKPDSKTEASRCAEVCGETSATGAPLCCKATPHPAVQVSVDAEYVRTIIIPALMLLSGDGIEKYLKENGLRIVKGK